MSRLFFSLPSLDNIKGFVAVARRMSIKVAADDLCLTQSAVSRQIQALETQLGVPLFRRRHRALELTPEGERLLHLATPWFEQLRDFAESVAKPDGHRRVSVTASNGVCALWILPRLGSFQADHPSIDISVIASNTILDLDREDIDLGISYCLEADAPNEAIRLFKEEVVPVASPDVAERAFRRRDGLTEEVLLEFDDRTRPWLRWEDWLRAMGIPETRPRSYLHFNQYDQTIQSAIQGQGIALGRLALVYPMLQEGKLVTHVEGQFATNEYGYWLTYANKEPRPEVRLFADWIVREVRNADEIIDLISKRNTTRNDIQLTQREFR